MMKKWDSFRHKPNKLFLLYFFSFFMVILIPVFYLSISSYQLTISTVQDELSQANSNTLKQTGSSVERVLNEVNTLSIQLGLDGRIYALARNPANSYLLNDVIDRIKSLSVENMYVHSIQIYFKENNQIISSEGANRYYSSESFDEWIDHIRHSKTNSLWIPSRSFINQDGNSFRIISLTRKIPVAFPETSGYVAIHIYENHFKELLLNMDPERRSNVHLINSVGQVITSYDEENRGENEQLSSHITNVLNVESEGSYVDKTQSHDVLISYGAPLYNGWKLMSETNLNYLYNKLSYIRQVIVLTGLILILLGAVISYYLSKSMFSPIKKLLEKSKRYQKELSLPADEKEGNTFNYFNDLFDNMVGKHKASEASYKANYQAMLDRFIFCILYNKISSSLDIDEKIRYLNLPVTRSYYTVIIIEIDDYSAFAEEFSTEHMNLFRFSLNNIAQEIISRSFNCLSTEINDNQLAVLINLQSDNEDHRSLVNQLAEEIIETAKVYLKFSVTISIGGVVKDISQSCLSFTEASDVIHYKVVLGGNKVICYDDINQEKSNNYYYPVQLERNIINNILAGNEEQVKACLHDLRSEMNEKQTLSYDNIFRLYNRLLEAAIDLLLNTNISVQDVFGASYNLHQELAKHETVEAITEWMEQKFSMIIEHLRGNTNHNSSVEQTLRYIEENYQKDLSVELIADAIQLNNSYLSRIFKQHTGKTILEHLTIKRIEESKSLLIETKLNLHEISQRVGYNNTNSYIRFFKKYEGITPGEYRKSNIIGV